MRRQLSPFLRSSNAERSRNAPTTVVPDELEWQEFSAAYFPGRRRHDLETLTAYATYRRSRVAEQPSPEEAEPAVDAWEDDGGPAL